jgi:hypothetical protein
MDKDTTLDLALEALESCGAGHITDGGNQWYDEKLVDKAITAIKQARSAPVQEPVAITEQMAFAFHNAITDGAIGTDDLMDIMRGLEAAFAHITTPPAAQRQWVGLTEEEIIRCTPTWGGTVEDVAIAIEAKLKEKNT